MGVLYPESEKNAKYQAPLVEALDLPYDLHKHLYKGNVLEARKAFFTLLVDSNQADLIKLRKKIQAMLSQFGLKVSPKDIFSLRAMRDELLKQIGHLSNDEMKAALLHNNQWIAAFYDDNSAKELHRNMRNYALAIDAKKTQKESIAFIMLQTIVIAASCIFTVLLSHGRLNGPWLLPLLATQLACNFFMVLTAGIQQNAGPQSCLYHDQVKSLTLSDSVDFTSEFPQKQAIEAQDLLSAFNEDLNNLDKHGNQDLSSIIDKMIGYNGYLHALKQLDQNAYSKILTTLNELDIAQTYANINQIANHVFSFQLSLRIFLTSLVALSIGLTHTHRGSLMFGGILLGIYLGVSAWGCAISMLNPTTRPETNKKHLQEKIVLLKNIKSELESTLSNRPVLPPPYEPHPYEAQTGRLNYLYDTLTTLTTLTTPTAPPIVDHDHSPRVI